MDSQFRIIPFHPKRATETVRMWRASKEAAIGRPDKHPFEDHVAYLTSVLVVEYTVHLVLDVATDGIVAVLASGDTEISQLYVHNDFQRRGIGSRLLEMAKENSSGTLGLYTFEVNTAAQRFYEQHGFREIGRGYPNEEDLPDIRYEWTAQSSSVS